MHHIGAYFLFLRIEISINFYVKNHDLIFIHQILNKKKPDLGESRAYKTEYGECYIKLFIQI